MSDEKKNSQKKEFRVELYLDYTAQLTRMLQTQF